MLKFWRYFVALRIFLRFLFRWAMAVFMNAILTCNRIEECSIIDLPIELQHRILTYVLHVGTITPRRHGLTKGVHASILRTCRHFHKQGRIMLYGFNTFDFRNCWFGMQGVLSLEEFRISIGATNALLVRTVAIGNCTRLPTPWHNYGDLAWSERLDTNSFEILPITAACRSFENLTVLIIWFLDDLSYLNVPYEVLVREWVTDFKWPKTLAIVDYDHGSSVLNLEIERKILAQNYTLTEKKATLLDIDLREKEWEFATRHAVFFADDDAFNSLTVAEPSSTVRLGGGDRGVLVPVGGRKMVVREAYLERLLKHRGVLVYRRSAE